LDLWAPLNLIFRFGGPHKSEVIRNLAHEEHEEMMEWVGGEFNPERFDIGEINDGLKHIK